MSNTTFRMFKKWAHEGGIATPLLIHYPALSSQGLNTADVGHVLDLMPTCLELAGVPYPAIRAGNSLPPLEGRSLVPLLKGEAREPARLLFYDHEGHQAVRKGDWKLVKEFGETDWHLYHMQHDRLKLNDLVTE